MYKREAFLSSFISSNSTTTVYSLSSNTKTSTMNKLIMLAAIMVVCMALRAEGLCGGCDCCIFNCNCVNPCSPDPSSKCACIKNGRQSVLETSAEAKFKELDEDEDSYISMAEVSGRVDNAEFLFNSADKDKDGKLSRHEFDADLL